MAGVLQHLRSSTLNKRPNPASMVDGQVAINYASGSPGMFFKDSNGSLVKVGPVHVGATAPNVSPASGGTAGNSLGEQWLDTSGGTYVFKIWDGAAWRSEAGEFVNSTGDTMTGSLTMGPSADLIFEGSVDDGFETTLTVVNPTADRTITLPNVSGTVVTTGDSETVTSTMIRNDTIVNADINSSAAIAGTKISPDFGSQTVQTTGIFSAAGGSAAAPSIAFTGDTNTGIYSPGADQVAISTGGSGRLFVDANGRVGVAAANPINAFEVQGSPTANLFAVKASSGGDCLAVTARSAGGGGIVSALNNDQGDYAPLELNSDFIYFRTRTGAGTVAERLRITSAGFVGVGTSSPGSKLHVAGGATVVSIGSNDAGDTGAAIFYGTGTKYNWKIGAQQNVDNALEITPSTAVGGTTFTTPLLVINSAGNVGIGTTDARGVLRLAGSSANAFPNNGGLLWLTDTNAATDYKNWSVSSINGDFGVARGSDAFNTGQNAYKITGSATQGYVGEHIWYTNNSSEKVRISNSGQLLVGTSSALSGPYWSNLANLQVAGSYGVGHFATFVDSTSGAGLVFQKSRNASVGGNTIVSNNDLLMDISIEGNDGTGFKQAAVIQCQVDGTPGANDMPGRLVFSTTADGASSPTERMRIASNGKTTIKGSTSDSSAYSLEVTESGDIVHFTIRNDGVILTGTDTLSPYNNTTASAANLFVTSGGELQRSTSSLKYKKNVQDAPYGLQELMALRAVTYQGKSASDGNTVYGGLIAEEVDAAGLQEFVQYADDGTPDALAYGNMVSLCIKAIQEQQAMIAELQAKVAVFESA
jgi:hypothetical protein